MDRDIDTLLREAEERAQLASQVQVRDAFEGLIAAVRILLEHSHVPRRVEGSD